MEELETSAREMAQGAGLILRKSFGRKISVEYKDKNNLDPVTEVDRDCQNYLAQEIIRRYPSHGILGKKPRKSLKRTANRPDRPVNPTIPVNRKGPPQTFCGCWTRWTARPTT